MNNRLILRSIFCSLLMIVPQSVHAQSPDDHNEGSRMTHNSLTGEVTLSWWGRSGNFYRIDVSEDLLEWTALPIVEEGFDEPIEWGFAVNQDRFFYRLRIFSLFAEDRNMIIQPGGVTFIGDPEMRGIFENGNEHGLEIDQGIIFSTGIAANWNVHNEVQNEVRNLPGDEDLEIWMTSEGFDEFTPGSIPENTGTSDAAGVMIEFEPEFSGAGTIEIAFLFASDEYYEPDYADSQARNDGMAIFLFEMDSNGVIPSSMVNIGVLPATDSGSRAINVENVGEAFRLFGNAPACNNIGFFRKNSQYSQHYGNPQECSGLAGLPPECGDPSEVLSPCLVGYSGYTGRFMGEGTVQGGTKYLLKIVVADQSDGNFDSATFLENGSIRCIPNE